MLRRQTLSEDAYLVVIYLTLMSIWIMNVLGRDLTEANVRSDHLLQTTVQYTLGVTIGKS